MCATGSASENPNRGVFGQITGGASGTQQVKSLVCI